MINRKLAVFLPIALGLSVAGAAYASPFNGPYVGGQIGYSIYDTTLSASDATGSANFDGLSGSGADGGLYAGWGMLFTPNWYGGIEAEYNWSGAEFSASASDASGSGTVKIKDKDNYGVGARLGWLPNSDTMLYTRLGWQRVRLETTGSGTISGVGFSGSRSVDHDGFRLGFGVEMAMTSNWLVRAEYDHTWYNKQTVDTGVQLEPNNDIVRVGLTYQF